MMMCYYRRSSESRTVTTTASSSFFVAAAFAAIFVLIANVGSNVLVSGFSLHQHGSPTISSSMIRRDYTNNKNHDHDHHHRRQLSLLHESGLGSELEKELEKELCDSKSSSGTNCNKASSAATIANIAKETANIASQMENNIDWNSVDPYYIDAYEYESYSAVGTKPDASYMLAYNNFIKQGSDIIKEGLQIIGIKDKNSVDKEDRLPDCLNFILTNESVKNAEIERNNNGGKVDSHPVSQTLYDLGCLVLDNLFDNRPIQRFWFLETIARIPYFSYVSMLHLYESFGWFRAVELRKIHSAEDWNELHHLLIMESLGGNTKWSDRFVAYHTAFLYYWFLILVYLGSPRIAYQFMELLEAHAVDTYTTFVKVNKQRLSELPPPSVAVSYYKYGDLYMFDDFQTTRAPGSRRPPCDTLLDVFTNIAIDEGEHVKTMQACQDYAKFGTKVVSSHEKYKYNNNDNNDSNRKDDNDNNDKYETTAAAAEYKRKMWKEWSEAININNNEIMDGMNMNMGNEMDA